MSTKCNELSSKKLHNGGKSNLVVCVLLIDILKLALRVYMSNLSEYYHQIPRSHLL